MLAAGQFYILSHNSHLGFVFDKMEIALAFGKTKSSKLLNEAHHRHSCPIDESVKEE